MGRDIAWHRASGYYFDREQARSHDRRRSMTRSLVPHANPDARVIRLAGPRLYRQRPVLALLALLAARKGAGRWRWCGWRWRCWVDGIDGSLARWARVKERAARVDGDPLDLVIDI